MPAPVVLKVVLTNRTAAKAKYGTNGWRRIRAAVTGLAKADQARGVTTRFFAVDSAADCRRVGATAVAAADPEATKAAVDRIFATWGPAYLLLLGGPELVPLVDLANPLWTGDPNHDPDPTVPSDLPYACDSPYSLTASSYRGPTRVVGRVADLTGESDPHALLVQLHHAATGGSAVRSSPEPVLAVSAKVWTGSTTKSIAGLPDVTGAVRTSPPDGPVWTAADWRATGPLRQLSWRRVRPRAGTASWRRTTGTSPLPSPPRTSRRRWFRGRSSPPSAATARHTGHHRPPTVRPAWR